jgi:hypothetical protein
VTIGTEREGVTYISMRRIGCVVMKSDRLDTGPYSVLLECEARLRFDVPDCHE